MNTGDTIAAIASAPGQAPRAILRISGPGTLGVLHAMDPDVPSARGVHRVRLVVSAESGGLVVPALVMLFRGGRSYTGEDAAEILLTGNPHLADRLLQRVLSIGAGIRLAEPGEFTARAFLAGRLSAEQAEGVQALIAAQTDAQLDAARRLLGGETGAAYRRLADELATALALVEAGIDFTDEEDVVAISSEDLRGRLERAASEIDAMLGSSCGSEARAQRPVAVLAGAPNAGKSMLFNALLGRERVVVSGVPGTTRDAIVETLHLADDHVHAAEPDGCAPTWGDLAIDLVDLAGLDAGFAGSGVVDRAAHGVALERIGAAEIVLLCDPLGRFEAGLDSDARDAMAGATVLRVRTKADLPHERTGAGALEVCALDGFNVGALRRALADAAESALELGTRGEEAAVLPRHGRALRAARAGIGEALELESGRAENGRVEGAELIAGSMRSALDHLGSISGRISPDDVIGRIFATFCVGK